MRFPFVTSPFTLALGTLVLSVAVGCGGPQSASIPKSALRSLDGSPTPETSDPSNFQRLTVPSDTPCAPLESGTLLEQSQRLSRVADMPEGKYVLDSVSFFLAEADASDQIVSTVAGTAVRDQGEMNWTRLCRHSVGSGDVQIVRRSSLSVPTGFSVNSRGGWSSPAFWDAWVDTRGKAEITTRVRLVGIAEIPIEGALPRFQSTPQIERTDRGHFRMVIVDRQIAPKLSAQQSGSRKLETRWILLFSRAGV